MNKKYRGRSRRFNGWRACWLPACRVISHDFGTRIPHGGIVVDILGQRLLLLEFGGWHKCDLGQLIGIEVQNESARNHQYDEGSEKIEKLAGQLTVFRMVRGAQIADSLRIAYVN